MNDRTARNVTPIDQRRRRTVVTPDRTSPSPAAIALTWAGAPPRRTTGLAHPVLIRLLADRTTPVRVLAELRSSPTLCEAGLVPVIRLQLAAGHRW